MVRFLSVFLLLLPAQEEKVRLQWNFAKGKELRYRTVVKNSFEAGTTSLKQEMTAVLLMKVREVDEDGTAALDAKYESVAASATGLQQYTYDSTKGGASPDEPAAVMLAKLVGAPFTMKMTPSGRITEVDGFRPILDEMLAETQDDNVRYAARQMLSDRSFRAHFQQAFVPLPSGEIAPGNAWPASLQVPTPALGTLKLTCTSTLASVEGGKARINQELRIEPPPKGDASRPLSDLIRVKESKGTGKVDFLLKRGLLGSSKTEMIYEFSSQGENFTGTSTLEVTLVEKP